jgi:hypothetical protein
MLRVTCAGTAILLAFASLGEAKSVTDTLMIQADVSSRCVIRISETPSLNPVNSIPAGNAKVSVSLSCIRGSSLTGNDRGVWSVDLSKKTEKTTRIDRSDVSQYCGGPRGFADICVSTDGDQLLVSVNY